jgi:hypothetical protein
MKNQVLKIITLLLFTSVAISSCSVEYREHRRARYDHHDDHRYNEVHRY